LRVWLLTVVVAAAPSVFLLTFFYLKDRYEREPLRHILMAFGLWMYAMIAGHGIASTAETWVPRDWLLMGGEPAKLFDAFLLSGFVEELAKWVVLIAAVYHWEEFDEPLDGVVYGVALALGFATVENVLCVVRDGLGTGVLRALFAVPAHALFGAVMGFYFGRAKFGDAKWAQPLVAFALAAAVALHGLYDFILQALRGAWMYGAVAAGSVALWAFVLRRVHHAQDASPFKR
jgi:RsiW-degrading membrane proteinase PrsW (M82 family)